MEKVSKYKVNKYKFIFIKVKWLFITLFFWFKWTCRWIGKTWIWSLLKWPFVLIGSLLRELFMAYEMVVRDGKLDVECSMEYKFNTRKLWATTFCTAAAIAVYLRVAEAWIIFHEIYDKNGDILEKLKKFSDIIKNGTPLSNILSVGVLTALLTMATTAVGWYTLDKIKRQNNNSE